MLAIPLTRNISWRNPPVLTVVLIVINLFVYFVSQRDDVARYLEAKTFYFESGLDEIEIPLYLQFLEENPPEWLADLSLEKLEKGKPEWNQLYYRIEYDKRFMDKVASGEVVLDDPGKQRQWRFLRKDYEAIRQRIVSLQHGFRPARASLETLFSSMFLHSSAGHLFGNMLFLWLTGCLIEYGCRRYMFIVIYALGGMAATGLFWLFNADSLVPLVGASGAISGIMGAFTVLYGLKRVRFFVTLGFYFNYLAMPAIIMLPLWVGNELWQMMAQPGSQVAYAAHLGGLVGGAAIAYIAQRIPGCLDPEGFEEARGDTVSPLVEKALSHMGKLEFAEARKLLVAADELKPDDPAILGHLFTIDSQAPDQFRLHQTGQRLMNRFCRQPQTYAKAHDIYRQYIQVARPAKLGAAMYLRLSQVFCELGELQDAHRLVAMLVKKCPQMEMLPSVLYKLARAHIRKGNPKQGKSCLVSLCKSFPSSSEARMAKQQLKAASKS